VIEGDCIAVMAELDEASVDAVVTDPPYGLEFMGKEWDGANGFRRSLNPADAGRDDPFGRASARGPEYRAGRLFQAWSTSWATEALRVLKPGGHLLSFGGTRTYHRLTCALEDAGFEVRDCIAWLYGSGFPKSHNLDGEWDGWGTALKPAFEPIVLARKPMSGTVAENVLRHGTGALNVNGTRIEAPEGVARFADKGEPSVGIYGDGLHGSKALGVDGSVGRWPANVLLDPEAAAMLDDIGDSGGASRFFYTAKTSRAERERGVVEYGDDIDEHRVARLNAMGDDPPEDIDPVSERFTTRARNHHPTVKPVDLMQWLCRLVTPPGGLVLDPFVGSGSTGMAALREGFDFIGIEREPEYVAIARARIVGDAPLFNVEEATP
jgi:site-specific DNA-methyltransferase (adenine-specific)